MIFIFFIGSFIFFTIFNVLTVDLIPGGEDGFNLIVNSICLLISVIIVCTKIM